MNGKRVWKAVKQVVAVAPGLFALEYLSSALYGVSLALTPLFMESAFEGVRGFSSGMLPISGMLLRLSRLFAVIILSEIAAGLSDYFGETYSDLTVQKLSAAINGKISKLPAIDFEVPETLNAIQKSYRGAYYSRSAVHILMDFLTMYLPYFLVYAWYLYKSRPIFPIALLLIFCPVMLTQRAKKKIYESQADETSAMQRKKDMLISYQVSKETAKETRTLGAQGFFAREIDRIQQTINHVLAANDRKMRRIDLMAILVNLAGYFAVIWLLFASVKDGVIPISTFVAVFASVRTAYEQLEEVFHDRASEFSEALANMKNYLAFLDVEEPDSPSTNAGEITALEAENLGFTYPDGTTALQGVHFHAVPGNCIAVVGENGSGKTTLAKLLAGIYTPTSGYFRVNGTPENLSAFRGGISQCFQHFCRYQMTLKENVTISRLEKESAEEIAEGLEQVRFSASSKALPEGMDTMLGRTFGGVELSGGQWQRIALTRANYRESELLILDEPTAAIDPLHEGELYHAFQESCSGKIGVIITHRLGIVKLCSAVLVLKGGKQVDFGTHGELLERCPYYRSLWESQANLYT